MTKVQDGAGSGNYVKVNANNRMYVNAVTTAEDLAATTDGRSFNLNTGVITLTDAADTPIMYVKNTEQVDLHVTAIVVGIAASTGATLTMNKITIVRNPTVGTIISSTPTDIDIKSNRNFGSPSTLSADAYKGATGDTMTDGSDHIIFFQTSNGRLFATIDEVIPKGQAIGIKFDPATGNTSQDVYAALICHKRDENA